MAHIKVTELNTWHNIRLQQDIQLLEWVKTRFNGDIDQALNAAKTALRERQKDAETERTFNALVREYKTKLEQILDE